MVVPPAVACVSAHTFTIVLVSVGKGKLCFAIVIILHQRLELILKPLDLHFWSTWSELHRKGHVDKIVHEVRYVGSISQLPLLLLTTEKVLR